jgi:GAF domain-containing protein
MSDATSLRDTNHAPLLQRLHQASRAIAVARDEAAVGQALMEFAASGDVEVARLLIFTTDVDGPPTMMEMREGWTVDDRPAQPYGTQMPLADYPLLEFMDADSVFVCENVKSDERLNEPTRRIMAISGLGSFAVVPLTTSQDWLGTLIIGRDTPSTYDEELIYAWWTLVAQAAAIIQNARLFEQTTSTLADVRESERLLRSIIDATPDWIFIKDQEHRYRLVNQGYADALHLAPDDFIGKNDLELGFPEELVKGDPEKGIRGFWTDDRQVMDSSEPLVNPYDPATIDDQLHIFHTIKTPLRDETGEVWGVLAFARDVTEREQLLADLERRSAQLQTAAEVSRAASSILDPDELIQQVVNLAQERFDLYYAGLFLVDQTGEWTGEPGKWAALRAGTGEAGRQMVEQGHKLEIGGDSMIGSCIANAQARIALDVGLEATRFDNPLLPKTRSEMALPLLSFGQAIGAMTIQSEQEAAFSEDDIAVLQTMADQVASAIENARLFAQAQIRVERERLVRTITDRIRQATDREAIMRATLQELGQMLGASKSIVRLGTPEQLFSSQETLTGKTEEI